MTQPVRVFLDTSAYDYFLDGKEFEKAVRAVERGKIAFYGFKVTRQEVRNIPKNIRYDQQNLRIKILEIYDQLTLQHHYEVNPVTEWLASQYAQAYRGKTPTDEMKNDFLIVACATIHRLDILVSNDKRTMLSPEARETYVQINQKNDFQTPRFYTMEEFKLLL